MEDNEPIDRCFNIALFSIHRGVKENKRNIENISKYPFLRKEEVSFQRTH